MRARVPENRRWRMYEVCTSTAISCRDEPGEYDCIELGRDRAAKFGWPTRIVRHHLRHDRLRRGSGERRLADEHLVGHAAERVDVAGGGDLALAHRLLGAHVVRRAEGE